MLGRTQCLAELTEALALEALVAPKLALRPREHATLPLGVTPLLGAHAPSRAATVAQHLRARRKNPSDSRCRLAVRVSSGPGKQEKQQHLLPAQRRCARTRHDEEEREERRLVHGSVTHVAQQRPTRMPAPTPLRHRSAAALRASKTAAGAGTCAPERWRELTHRIEETGGHSTGVTPIYVKTPNAMGSDSLGTV